MGALLGPLYSRCMLALNEDPPLAAVPTSKATKNLYKVCRHHSRTKVRVLRYAKSEYHPGKHLCILAYVIHFASSLHAVASHSQTPTSLTHTLVATTHGLLVVSCLLAAASRRTACPLFTAAMHRALRLHSRAHDSSYESGRRGQASTVS